MVFIYYGRLFRFVTIRASDREIDGRGDRRRQQDRAYAFAVARYLMKQMAINRSLSALIIL